jgi:ABC-type anion transport system duplicated permease subunit
MISSWIFVVLLVEASPTVRIISREEPESAVRAETGALGRLVYGIISIICLCALSFTLGIFIQSILHCTTNS